MRIYLDDAACEQIHADSVAQAVNAAATIAKQRGRTIVDVIVDGRKWDADRIDSAEANAKNAAKEVRLASTDPLMLVCEAFADAADVLGEIDRLQQTAAEMLQGDKGPQAMERLGQALELWGSVHQAMAMGATMANIDLAPQQPSIERLTNQLRSVRTSLEKRDVVALADTLLYDLPDVVNEWRALLHTLRERVRAEAKGGRKA